MDLGGWLRSLGLDQYEATFRANEIDADVLPELTEIDLEKLGVPLGHRKRLLKAIAGLTAAEKLTPTSASTSLRAETDAAERRQVTVMFSRPGRLDGTLRPHGPGGLARGHFGLSEMRRRDRAPFRRVRGEIHGRRRAGVFRLSAGP